jgi:hypothetical protein
VVPQVPAGQQQIAGSDILVGTGHLDVKATRDGKVLSVTVAAAVSCQLSLGVVLPAGAKVASVTLDGRPAGARRTSTTRGDELVVQAHSAGRHALVVTLR